MRIGNYEVTGPLGSGGMSDAFLARSPSGRVVVLKKPRGRDPEVLARMRDEARLGGKLYHENLVETLDTFEHEGVPVVVLGFVEGPTLDALRKKAALLPAAVARIGCQIAEALGCIHGALGDDGRPLGAVHRDVSGRNIIVTPKGDAVLIDLGIARTDEVRAAHTATGMVVGTLRYMAPELVDGAPATPASDFYSLGCVLIEAATGKAVFDGTPSTIAVAIVARGPLQTPAATSLDPRLRPVIAKMVAANPRDRFQEAHEVSRALRELEASLGGGAAVLAERAGNEVVAAAPDASAPGAAPAPVTGLSATGLSATGAVRTAEAPPVAPAPWNPPPPAPPPPVRSFGPPPAASAPLELAVEPRRKSAGIEVPADGRGWYPKVNNDRRWLTEALKKAVVFVLVVGAAVVAWRVWSGRKADEAATAAAQKAAEEARLFEKAMAETAKPSPGCGGKPGAVWIYTDKHGQDVIVDAVGKIPKAYRAKARCALPTR